MDRRAARVLGRRDDRTQPPRRRGAALAAALRIHLPEAGDLVDQLAPQIIMVTGAVWTHARPSSAMFAAYEAGPSLEDMRLDFAPTLPAMLTTLISGTLTAASAG